MMPIGFLMREHRLIEKAASLLSKEAERLSKGGKISQDFVIKIADFFRTYADRLHHGKEEDILFKQLAKKRLSKEHSAVMQRLIDDHKLARLKVTALTKTGSSKEAAEIMNALAKLYPEHIRIEDKEFFFPCMNYFSESEQQLMHDECLDFDKNFIHKRYEEMILGLK